jgi:hypothetical protein
MCRHMGGVEIKLHSLWNLAIDGAHWSPPHQIQSIRAKRDNGNHWTGDWVSYGPGMNVLDKRKKIPSPTGNQTPDHPAHNLVTLLSYFGYLSHFSCMHIKIAIFCTVYLLLLLVPRETQGLQNQTHFYLNTGRSHFMLGFFSWKNTAQIKHKFPFTALYFLYWQPQPVECMTILVVDIQTSKVCSYCTYSIHIFLYHICIGFQCSKKWLTFMVFGLVHSDRTVAFLIEKHFSSWLSISYNYICIIMNCM